MAKKVDLEKQEELELYIPGVCLKGSKGSIKISRATNIHSSFQEILTAIHSVLCLKGTAMDPALLLGKITAQSEMSCA